MEVFGLCILVIAVLLRLWPRLRHADLVYHDAAFHLAYIDLIRRHGFRPPESDPRFLVVGRGEYPAGYHRLLALLGNRATRLVDRFGGAAFDLGTGAIIAFALYWHSFVDAGLIPGLVGLYLIFPTLVAPVGGPRAYGLTPRVFSEFLFASMIGATLFLYPASDLFHESVLFVGLSITAAAVLLSSRFGLQNLVFVAPVLTIIGRDPMPVAIVFVAMALAYVAAREFFPRQLEGHCAFLSRLAWTYRRGQLGTFELQRIFELWTAGRKWATLRYAVAENALVAGTVWQPLLIPAVAVGLTSSDLGPSQGVSIAFCLAAIIPWVATSLGVLQVLGRGDRYLMQALPAQWFLAWSLVDGPLQGSAMVVLFGVSVPIYWIGFKSFLRKAGQFDLTSKMAIAEIIDREPRSVLLCLNLKDAHAMYLLSRARLVAPIQLISAVDQDEAFMARLWGQYPMINAANLDHLIVEYGARYVLARNKDLERPGPDGRPLYRLDRYSEIHRNRRYRLFRVG